MKIIAIALLLIACTEPPERDRVTAAAHVSALYGQSKLAPWEIEVHAEGDDCRVLRVHLGVVADDSMIELLHYGHGGYGVTPGGFQGFYRTNGFRGIAYTDDAHVTWASGDLRRRESDAPIDVGHGVHRMERREGDMVLGGIAGCR